MGLGDEDNSRKSRQRDFEQSLCKGWEERMYQAFSGKIRPHGNTKINRKGLIIKSELASKKP